MFERPKSRGHVGPAGRRGPPDGVALRRRLRPAGRRWRRRRRGCLPSRRVTLSGPPPLASGHRRCTRSGAWVRAFGRLSSRLFLTREKGEMTSSAPAPCPATSGTAARIRGTGPDLRHQRQAAPGHAREVGARCGSPRCAPGRSRGRRVGLRGPFEDVVFRDEVAGGGMDRPGEEVDSKDNKADRPKHVSMTTSKARTTTSSAISTDRPTKSGFTIIGRTHIQKFGRT